MLVGFTVPAVVVRAAALVGAESFVDSAQQRCLTLSACSLCHDVKIETRAIN